MAIPDTFAHAIHAALLGKLLAARLAASLMPEILPQNDGRAESDTTNLVPLFPIQRSWFAILVPDSFVLVPDPIPDST